MRLQIPEILQLVSDARTHAEKVQLLREHQTLPLEQVLQYNFHPDIKFVLPEGDAPYKKETDVPIGKSHTNLYREGRRLYIFLQGYAPNLKPYRKEQLFIEMLEGIHWTEADMLIKVKDKLLTDLYPGVTYESARDAFAQLLPQEAPKKVVAKVDKPVKLAIPDISFYAKDPAKVEVQEETRPLEQSDLADFPKKEPKEKKPLTEAQKAGLLKAQAARRASAAAKKAAQESNNE